MTEQSNYIQDALKTASPSFHGNKIPLRLFEDNVQDAITILAHLDLLKKSIFYGKLLPEGFSSSFNQIEANCNFLPTRFEDQEKGVQIIHAIIGIATEAGELLEALQNTARPFTEFNFVNAKEECGDLFWYLALLAHACGFSFEDAQKTNIEKLKARYPEKFTEEAAINRNLEKELEILSKTS